jgi:hypothetical protein
MTEHCGCGGYSSHENYCKCGEHCKCGDKSDHGECDWSEKLLRMADQAWKEVLIDKIKAEIEKNESEQLQKLAEIVANANGEKWQHKMAAKMKCEDYRETVKDFFMDK